MTRLQVLLSGIRIPADARDFSLPPKLPDRLSEPQTLLRNVYPVYFLGLKRPRREVQFSLPSGVEVEREWSYTSAATVCFHGVDRDNFTSTGTPTVRSEATVRDRTVL